MTAADRLAALVSAGAGIDLPVRVRTWDGGEAGPPGGPVLVVRNRRALRRLLWAPGELGLARAYVTGDLDVEGDVTAGFRQAWAANAAAPVRRPAGWRGGLAAAGYAARLGVLGPPPAPPAAEARLHGRLHTRRRDSAAIAHHYDLGNDFYELLLDEHMAYSSAYFTAEGQSLHDAQTAKLDLICTKLRLGEGDRLLDVGCGWGSLLIHAAREYGVHATGVTLSEQQRAFVEARVARLGLAGRVTVRRQHYRDLTDHHGRYDAVSSIEMGEHVGQEHYPGYVQTMYDALRPGGLLLLQQMSRHAGAAPGGGAFIESYIAPDMHMRPLWQTVELIDAGGFEIRDVQALREHYVRTVDHWLDTFEARYREFVALAGEQVARVWRLYLVGGRLAFEQGRMGVDQILARKPGPPLSAPDSREGGRR